MSGVLPVCIRNGMVVCWVGMFDGVTYVEGSKVRLLRCDCDDGVAAGAWLSHCDSR